MAVQYATIAQYLDFQGLPPREPRPSDEDGGAAFDAETRRMNALLQRASDRITQVVRLARVRYMNTGLPRDAAVAEAFARATAAQAVQFDEVGGPSGNTSGFNSVSLIGVQFSGPADAQSAAQARDSSEALSILSAAGIFTTRVRY
jgi:hypothetical protein